MSLKLQVETDIKAAMLAKDKQALTALRSIKSLILLAETEKGAEGSLSEEKELQLLVKAAKQRKESMEIYVQQNREDLAQVERAELEIINRYLPQPLSDEEVKARVAAIINQVGATDMKDMGKVMGMANQSLAGKADGKAIAAMVKEMLANLS